MPTNRPVDGNNAFDDIALKLKRTNQRITAQANNRLQALSVFIPWQLSAPVNGQMSIHPRTGQVWYYYKRRWRPMSELIAEATYEASTDGGTAQVTTDPTYLVSYWIRNTTTTEGLVFDIEEGTGGGIDRGKYTLGKYMGANNLTPKYFPTGIYIEWDAGVEANLEYVLA